MTSKTNVVADLIEEVQSRKQLNCTANVRQMLPYHSNITDSTSSLIADIPWTERFFFRAWQLNFVHKEEREASLNVLSASPCAFFSCFYTQ